MMGRLFLIYGLAALLAFVFYLYLRARARRRAEQRDGIQNGPTPDMITIPMLWGMGLGIMFLIIFLGSMVWMQQSAPAGSGPYLSPRLEDGRVVGPSFGPSPNENRHDGNH